MDSGNHYGKESDTERGKQRRPVVRHARGSTRILKEWYAAHSSWPYPTDQEKEELSERTGLTIRQVSYWFVNARRRNGGKLSSSVPTTTNSLLDLLSAGPFLTQDYDWSNMDPLERWRNSPPEQEPAPLHAISDSVQRSIGTFTTATDYPEYAFEMPTPNTSRPGSTSSIDFSTSEGSSDSSVYSYRSDSILNLSNQSNLRSRWKRSRKAVSRHAAKSRRNKEARDDCERIYQCTFCTDTFKSRYDWTRHEESLHLALEMWTCLPFGPIYINSDAQTECALCDVRSPGDAHLRSHQVLKCTGKPLSARSFRRKDHLRQHLRLVHGVQEMTASMSQWKTKVSEIKSRCGFCGESFSLWSDRNDHLSDHFKAGLLMKDWKGCRGLEPAIALLVENAMPPYLIGTEAQDADPFSASKGNTKTGFAAGDNSLAPNAFGALTAGLGDYVRTAKSASDHITDDALRHQARLILYGDDDPWNQTPADNGQWLEMFKAGYGLDNDHFKQQAMAECAANTYSASAEPMISSCPSNAKNFSPFTTEAVQQAVGFDSTMMQFELNFDAGSGDDRGAAAEPAFTIPWSWQTPECLAEFRQLGLLPTTPVACDPVVGGPSDLASSCSYPEPATSAEACENSLLEPGQVPTTFYDPMFVLPTLSSSPGMRELPPGVPPDDIPFVFDAELGPEWPGN